MSGPQLWNKLPGSQIGQHRGCAEPQGRDRTSRDTSTYMISLNRFFSRAGLRRNSHTTVRTLVCIKGVLITRHAIPAHLEFHKTASSSRQMAAS